MDKKIYKYQIIFQKLSLYTKRVSIEFLEQFYFYLTFKTNTIIFFFVYT